MSRKKESNQKKKKKTTIEGHGRRRKEVGKLFVDSRAPEESAKAGRTTEVAATRRQQK